MLQLTTLLLLTTYYITSPTESRCTTGCDLALASYYLQQGDELLRISTRFNTNTNDIIKYNRNTIPNQDSLPSFVRINIPFTCDCINGEFLGHVFAYDLSSGDRYETIAQDKYKNLTTGDWINRFNSYGPNRIPDSGRLNVTVNCSCGDKSVSKDYGLFVTYPLRIGESLDSVADVANVSSDLVRRYNSGVDFRSGSGLVYVPGRGSSKIASF